jgi:protein-L-isoaspartate(D-aspartate) O-methyltransferase
LNREVALELERDLERVKRELFQNLRREIGDERVIRVMEQVPRELFIPVASRHLAYDDIPLPIGEGQTISQPYIVALMTSALELKETDRVLELGTGSGYQAAILARLVPKGRVITVERIQSLAQSARTLLESMGYRNIQVRLAGETLGCPEEAPYDAIIVTAGAPKLPKALLDQLAQGGRMVIPVGSIREQELMKVVKTEEGYSVKTLGPCRFVPLVGEGAWPEDYRDWDYPMI